MTREEAIKIFQVMKKIMSIPNSDAARTIEAIDMAIEALTSQNLTEPINACEVDLISRNDAIEAVANAIWHYPNEQYKNLNDYDMAEALAKDAIKALPSALADIGDYADRLWKIAYERGKAEAEAEHDHEPGQWRTENGKPSKAEYSVYCSKCGSWSEYRTKYCGNCGSLMKEENDDK